MIYSLMEKKFLKYKDFTLKQRMETIKTDKFSETPIKGHAERLVNPSKRVKEWSKSIKSLEPVHTDPEDRANELLKIKGFIQSIGKKQANVDAEKYDSGTIKKFRKLCERLDLEFDDDYFHSLKDDAKDFAIIEKYRWNLPRPAQTAELLKIPFAELYQTESSNSPTYPSAHALYSNLIAGVLSKLYPEDTKDFLKLANLISLSRVSAGVHYMPDIKEGKRLANLLIEENLVKLPVQT